MCSQVKTNLELRRTVCLAGLFEDHEETEPVQQPPAPVPPAPVVSRKHRVEDCQYMSHMCESFIPNSYYSRFNKIVVMVLLFVGVVLSLCVCLQLLYTLCNAFYFWLILSNSWLFLGNSWS